MIRVYEYSYLFLKYLLYLLKTNKTCNIYITVGQSSAGFSRDVVFFSLGILFQRKIYAHLKGGNFKNFYQNSNFIFKRLIYFYYSKLYKVIILGSSLQNNFDFSDKINKKVIIVENGLTENIVKNDFKINMGSRINILYLSNLIQSKGYLDLLAALKILENDTLDFSCIFAGSIFLSPDDPIKMNENEIKFFLDSSINKLKNKDNVKFVGPVYNKEKIKLLKEADVFVLPTYYMNEGQPISIIEAMAYKNVIISTPYRSIIDLVSNGKEGILLSPKKPKLIANALLNLYLNKDKILQMKKQSYLTYSKKFTKEKHLSKMLEVLDLKSIQ